jgi:sarcosine oxidase, subunit beta
VGHSGDGLINPHQDGRCRGLQRGARPASLTQAEKGDLFMSKVVIIGGGIIGATTAYALLKKGITDITILERDTVGSGGTGKTAGIIRCHYGVSSICALALFSLDFFENAKERIGTDIEFEQVGYLVGIGEENLEPFRASLANQRRIGVQTEEITPAEAGKLWPTAQVDDFATFCLEKRGGYGDGYATVQGLAAYLRGQGVTIKQGAKVAELILTDGKATGVALVDGEVIEADIVVVAAGAWSVPLLSPLGIELPITPQFVQEVMIDPGMDLGAPPVFSDLVSMQYVHLRNGEMLFGNSDGRAVTPITDPDVYPNHASNEAIEITAEKAINRFPGVEDPGVSTTTTGQVDSTPDNNPIISATEFAGLFVAAGMSGHGFKISPGVGQLMADIIVEGESTIPNVKASDFRLTRFAEGDLLLSPYPYVGAVGIR